MPSLPPATQALLLANVAIFFLGQLLGPGLLSAFALWPLGDGFWPWQVATYSFLHGSFNHLFFNMLGLWMFGSELERLWGGRRGAGVDPLLTPSADARRTLRSAAGAGASGRNRTDTPCGTGF